MEPTTPTTIPFDQFAGIDLRAGKIESAERVEGSKKLLKLMINLGTTEEGGLGTRQILAGIGGAYEPETLVEKTVIVIANLAPRMMMGLESQGMLLAAGDPPVFLAPEKPVAPGTKIR